MQHIIKSEYDKIHRKYWKFPFTFTYVFWPTGNICAIICQEFVTKPVSVAFLGESLADDEHRYSDNVNAKQ